MPRKLKLTPYEPKITENDVREQIRQYLRIRQWYFFPVVQAWGSKPGVSDFIALKDGRILFIEAKSPKGKQSDVQAEFQETVEKNGFEYVLVCSVDDLIKRGI